MLENGTGTVTGAVNQLVVTLTSITPKYYERECTINLSSKQYIMQNPLIWSCIPSGEGWS